MLLLFGRPGAGAEILSLVGEVLDLGLGHEHELYLRFNAAWAHLQRGDAAMADRQMTRCVELVRRLRHSGADVPVAWWLFFRAVARDEHDEARVLLDRAIERHRRGSVVGQPELAATAPIALADRRSVVPDEVVALARHNRNPAFRAMVASALVSDDPDGALALLGESVPDGAWDYCSTYGDCLRVEVMAQAGAQDALPAALERIEPWAHEFAVYGTTECIGSVAYFAGRGREALGDADAARRHYEAAVTANRAGDVRPWLRRAQEKLTDLGTSRD